VTDPRQNGKRAMAFRLGRNMAFTLTGPGIFTMTTVSDDDG
jgi:hypothetical protein